MMTTVVGLGIDVHGLEAGNGITLGGLAIPCGYHVAAHSDGDLVLHAITDALLGSVCAGDLGEHFPSDDPRWANASSRIFVEEAMRTLQEKRAQLVFVDVTLVCQVPKLAPYRRQIQSSVAGILGLSEDFVSIKATTTDHLGFVGRKEGIGTFALATVKRDTNGI